MGDFYRDIKGDTRSLDNGSHDISDSQLLVALWPLNVEGGRSR